MVDCGGFRVVVEVGDWWWWRRLRMMVVAEWWRLVVVEEIEGIMLKKKG